MFFRFDAQPFKCEIVYNIIMGGGQSVQKSRRHNGYYTVDEVNYEWTISNFQKILSNSSGYCVSSEVLSVNVGSGNETFKIIFYPNGYNERLKEFASLWLQKSSIKEIMVTFTCSIIDAEGCDVIKKSRKQVLSIQSYLGWKTFCPRSIFQSENNSLLKDKNLRLKCSLLIFGDKALGNPQIEDDDQNMNASLSDLSHDLSELFMEEEAWDFILLVKNAKFRIHKAILSARSPVFKNIFKSSLSNPDMMVITDITESTVGELLHFIYSGKIGHLDVQEAADLYKAADKYELYTLRRICSKIIKTNLDVSNVLNALLLSEKYFDVLLQEMCCQYIVKNASKVQEQKEWMELLKNQPQIASIVFKRLVTKSDIK